MIHNIRRIGGGGFDPYTERDPLGGQQESANLPGTPAYKEKRSALKTIEAIRDATDTALVHSWTTEEVARVEAGEELYLEGLYYLLQEAGEAGLAVDEVLQEKVEAYREMVSDTITTVRATTVETAKNDEVGFGTEDDILSA